jgi:murein DD-endopeptidase MepM/ murein hydrolase activator NlpD
MKSKNSILLLALISLMVIPFSNVSAQASGPIYIVQPGDTLTAIALMFGTSVEALVEVNDIEDPSLLFPGMELIIPGFEEIKGVLVIHEVGYGETLSSLSVSHGAPSDTLARLNRIVSPGRLYAGQPLVLPEVEGDNSSSTEHSLLLPRKGESKLELAMKEGINPWSLNSLDQEGLRMWAVPGTPLVFPGGGQWAGALPEPIIMIDVQPLLAVQGRTTEVRMEFTQSIWVEGRLGDRSLNFFPLDPNLFVALQGIHALEEPGLYDLEIRLYPSQDSELMYAFAQPIRVLAPGYGHEVINGVPAKTIDPEVIEPEQELVVSLLSPATDEKLWEGPFQFPSDYYTESFVSVFGTRRSYNQGAYNYYHTGLDFYGSNVPIMAPAPGKVVYAGSLIVRGNVTYIDHGWGVYSGYFHQSEISVLEGDLVEVGQVIGKVGRTGRTTGPHLHWEIWVGGIPVDPLEWVEIGFP